LYNRARVPFHPESVMAITVEAVYENGALKPDLRPEEGR
jgi:hypothetical protein